MAINYQEKDGIFTISTNRTSYQMKVDRYGFLLHLYYGPKITGSMEYLLTYMDRGFSGNPNDAGMDRTYSMDALPQEYPVQGTGDYRATCLVMKNENGSYGCDLRYQGYEIKKGKYSLPGLPAMYAGSEEEAQTLEVCLEDRASDLTVTLLYGVFPEHDIITRAVKIENHGSTHVQLSKVHSVCLDVLSGDYDLIQFHGAEFPENSGLTWRSGGWKPQGNVKPPVQSVYHSGGT